MAPTSSLAALYALTLPLLAPLAAAKPGVVGLQFTKREITNPKEYNLLPRLRRRASTAQATIYNAQGNLLYLLNATVGTPAQKLALQLDTGSSDIWLPWAGSTICQGRRSQCTNGAYDDTKSSTFQEVLQNQFLISYVDGTKIGGDYINETFGVGGITLSQMTMGIAKQANLPGSDSSTPFQGIIGVGFDAGEAIVAQSNGRAGYPNVVSQMVLQGKISTRAYSLWLNDLESPEGSILFGGVDNAKYNGNLVILPLQSDTQTNAVDSFTVVFAGLNITGAGGKSVYNTDMTVPVILDSGTTLTYLPDSIAAAIAQGVGAVDNPNYGTVVPCDVANSQGRLYFKFGNANGPVIAADISQFVLPFPSDVSSPKFRSGKTACRWGILPAEGNPNLFGDTFLRSAYVVYNIEGREVGIAQTNFNVTSQDILQITATSNLPGATSTATGTAQQTRTGAVYNTNGVGGAMGTASSAVATATGTGMFDLGTGTRASNAPSSTSTTKAATAAGVTVPSTPFVGTIVAAATVLLSFVGGSMFIFM